MDIKLDLTDRLGKQFSLSTPEEIRSFLEAERGYWEKQKGRTDEKSTPGLFGVPARIDTFLASLDEAEKIDSALPENEVRRHLALFERAKQDFFQWMAG